MEIQYRFISNNKMWRWFWPIRRFKSYVRTLEPTYKPSAVSIAILCTPFSDIMPVIILICLPHILGSYRHDWVSFNYIGSFVDSRTITCCTLSATTIPIIRIKVSGIQVQVIRRKILRIRTDMSEEAGQENVNVSIYKMNRIRAPLQTRPPSRPSSLPLCCCMTIIVRGFIKSAGNLPWLNIRVVFSRRISQLYAGNVIIFRNNDVDVRCIISSNQAATKA